MPEMRIGIDARSLSKKLTGIGYYLIEVIKELKKLNVQLVLFSPSPLTVAADVLEGIEVVSGSHTKAMGRLLWSEFQLPFLLKKHPTDIFWGPAHRFPVLLPRSQTAVLTIHDLVWRKVPYTMKLTTRLQEAFFMPLSLRRADRILADSMSTLSDLIDYQPQLKSKIRHVPLGCRTGLKQPVHIKTQKHLWFDALSQKIGNKPYILFTGTIEPRKNLVKLLEAFNRLPVDLRQKYNLIIAGGKGWGKVNLEQEIARHDLKDQVILTAYLADEALSYLYQHAYCLAMPSLYEGFGLPILEAHRCGVPVITSHISSMPQVTGDGGILVDPYSVASITDGLRQLLENQDLRQDLSARAIQNAKKYSWEQTARLVLDAFRACND